MRELQEKVCVGGVKGSREKPVKVHRQEGAFAGEELSSVRSERE